MIEIGVCAIAGFEETRRFWFDMRLCVCIAGSLQHITL